VHESTVKVIWRFLPDLSTFTISITDTGKGRASLASSHNAARKLVEIPGSTLQFSKAPPGVLISMSNSLSFKRSEILIPILDDLAADDQTLFSRNIAPPILTRLANQGMSVSTTAAELVFQGFRDALTKRGEDILSKMDHVLEGAEIQDFDKLKEGLKSEFLKRLELALRLANPEYLSSTESIRARINHPNMPSVTALSEHVEKRKPGWLARLDLTCENLRATQATRVFLKKGEVFAGNRTARAIFDSAKKTLDIIDTYFGPKVFDMLEISEGSVQIRLISDKSDRLTVQAYQDFKKQYGRVEFRRCDPKEIHDRYVIVDGVRAWHFGHSLKDLGEKDSEVNSVPSAEIVKRFEELWQKAKPVA
jgi:hypothetical protein